MPQSRRNRYRLVLSFLITASLLILQHQPMEGQTRFGPVAELQGGRIGAEVSNAFGQSVTYSGTGSIGYGFGMMVRHYLDSTFSFSSGLSLNRMTFNQEGDILNPEEPLFEIRLMTDDPATVDPIYEGDTLYRMRQFSNFTMIDFEILGEWRFLQTDSSGSFGLALGPLVSYFLHANQRITIDLVSPANGRILNGMNLPNENAGRTIILYDGEVPEAPAFTLGPRIGLFWESPMPDSGTQFGAGFYYSYWNYSNYMGTRNIHRLALRAGVTF